MDETYLFQSLTNLGPYLSLALQLVTAYMVYHLITSSSSRVEFDESDKKRILAPVKPKDTSVEIKANDERSIIRGVNIYGPYKKVR